MGKDILDELHTQFDIFIQNEKDLNAALASEATQTVVQMRILILSLILGSLIIGLALGISIARGITRSLAKLTEMANQIAAGNMSQAVDVKSHFEIDR